jgi:hypothetical protein
LNSPALGGRENLRDDRKNGGGEHTAGETLQATEDDELGHVLAEAAQAGRKHEHRRAAEQEDLAAIQVRELA